MLFSSDYLCSFLKSKYFPRNINLLFKNFIFVILMIALNYGIQKLNQIVFAPAICNSFGSNEFIYLLYCSTSRYDMPALMGSIVAVGITYIIKFFLDKFIVFKSKGIPLKKSTKEFLKYFVFAILTTIENIGIQFILRNFLNFSLEISIVLALTIGYSTKFFLDRKYVFRNTYYN